MQEDDMDNSPFCVLNIFLDLFYNTVAILTLYRCGKIKQQKSVWLPELSALTTFYQQSLGLSIHDQETVLPVSRTCRPPQLHCWREDWGETLCGSMSPWAGDPFWTIGTVRKMSCTDEDIEVPDYISHRLHARPCQRSAQHTSGEQGTHYLWPPDTFV